MLCSLVEAMSELGSEFKACPYCKEQIRASAMQCPFCMEWLEEKPGDIPESADAPTNSLGEPATSIGSQSQAAEAEMPREGELTSVPPIIQTAQESQPTPTDAKPPTSNYLLRHWRGEFSLGVSFWVNGFLANVFVGFVTTLGVAFAQEAELRTLSALVLLILGLSFALWLWQFVGTWRSAANHVKRGGLKGWAIAAQVLLFFSALRMFSATTHLVPEALGFWEIVWGDKRIPPCTIKVLPGGTEMELSGGLRAGTAQELDNALRANPQVNVLRLKSVGGRMHEGLKMGQLVRNHRLSTYVSDYCFSAATLIFIAGKERVVAERAQLGFHRGSFPGMTPGQLRSGDRKVRDAMRDAGITQNFIDHALSTPSEEMWYPSIRELRAAGVVTREDVPIGILPSSILAEEPANTPRQTVDGDVDRVLKTFTEFTRRWSDVRSKMNTELKSAGEPNPFSKELLQSQEKIREAVDIQTRREQIILLYRAKAAEEINWAINEFSTMRLSDETVNGPLRGWNVGFRTNLMNLEMFFQLHTEVEIAKKEFLVFMFDESLQYRFEDSKITFDQEAEQERYRALLAAVFLSMKQFNEGSSQLRTFFETTKEKMRKVAR